VSGVGRGMGSSWPGECGSGAKARLI
jgi:hypothetical protein